MNNEFNTPLLSDAQTKQTTEIEKRRISSQALFGSQREILITHSDDVYRLRITNNGKLILTK